MNKGDLITRIAEANNVSKAMAGRALDTFLANMAEALKSGDRVTIVGFGSFNVKLRAGQKGRNPRTGQRLDIPAHNVVKFKPGKKLLQECNATLPPGAADFRQSTTTREESLPQPLRC